MTELMLSDAEIWDTLLASSGIPVELAASLGPVKGVALEIMVAVRRRWPGVLLTDDDLVRVLSVVAEHGGTVSLPAWWLN